MFGRLVTYIAGALAALLVVGPVAAAPRYGNGVSTSCNVVVTAKAGHHVTAHIDVKGNASATVTGTVTVSVFRKGSARPVRAPRAAAVWSTSAHYNGAPLDITGPVLPRGSYRAVASFSADPGVYLDCQCFDNFRTKGVEGQHQTNPGSGGLPNTGGPAEWWLFLGLGLVVAGGSATYVARRRQHTL